MLISGTKGQRGTSSTKNNPLIITVDLSGTDDHWEMNIHEIGTLHVYTMRPYMHAFKGDNLRSIRVTKEMPLVL